MIKTDIYYTKPCHNQLGQALNPVVIPTTELISQGLAKRLVNYARNKLNNSGFECITTWDVEVYSIDGDLIPSKRSYTVKFINSKLGYVEVVGIYTNNGWPTLDYGLDIHQ